MPAWARASSAVTPAQGVTCSTWYPCPQDEAGAKGEAFLNSYLKLTAPVDTGVQMMPFVVMHSGFLCILVSCPFFKLFLQNQPALPLPVSQTSHSTAPTPPPRGPGSSASWVPTGQYWTRDKEKVSQPSGLPLVSGCRIGTVHSTHRSLRLADKNTVCPVNFEFQTNMNNV